MPHTFSRIRQSRITRLAIISIVAIIVMGLVACGYFTDANGNYGITNDAGTPAPVCVNPQTFNPTMCVGAQQGGGTVPTAVPTRPSQGTPGTGGQQVPLGTNQLLSTRTDFARVVLQPDGRIWQDQNQPSTQSQTSFNVDFTLPASLPGGNSRTWNGIRCVLSKDGAVIARNTNGVNVDLVPSAKYSVSCEDGVNNGFSLDLVQKAGGPTSTTYPKVISAGDPDAWQRVVLTQNGRVYMDKVYEGAPAYTVTFTIPVDAPGGPVRVFQGVNAVLKKDGKTIAGPGANVQIQIELGATYVVEGGAKNGGFALEVPR